MLGSLRNLLCEPIEDIDVKWLTPKTGILKTFLLDIIMARQVGELSSQLASWGNMSMLILHYVNKLLKLSTIVHENVPRPALCPVRCVTDQDFVCFGENHSTI